MIPVSLKLKNFLSYGVSDEPLDFTSFHVACLSGGNGQGKSALLEAMTWALWGEARKAAGNVKPDESLVRLGEDEMDVEFVFDLEGSRYMVKRDYSKRRKTERKNLYFNIFDSELGEYRNLTSTSKKDTQTIINDTLGLKYDTFINTSFLLQGRSDEFTKRNATQRKAVLSAILELDRYEKLKDRAQEHVREAKSKLEWADREKARLQAGLLELSEWEADLASVQAEIETQELARKTLLQTEAQLAEQLAKLEHVAQMQLSETQRLDANKRQKAQFAQHIQRYETQLQEAAMLISQAAQINDNYRKWKALQAEREVLDEKGLQLRVFEDQIKKLDNDRALKIQAAESELLRLRDQQKHLKQQIVDAELKTSELPQTQQRLKLAQEALLRKENLDKTKAHQQELQRKGETLRAEIHTKDAQLRAEITQQERQFADLQAKSANLEGLEAQRQNFLAQKQSLTQIQAELEELNGKLPLFQREIEDITKQGKNLKEQREAFGEKQNRIHSAQDEACPTCGTPLDEAHKQHIFEHYQTEIANLDTQLNELRESLKTRNAQKSEATNQVIALTNRRSAVINVEKDLAMLEAKIAQTSEMQSEMTRLRGQIEKTQLILKRGDHIRILQDELKHQEEKLQALNFDEKEYETVLRRVGALDGLKQTETELTELQGRLESFRTRFQKLEQDEKNQRTALDQGTFVAELEAKINAHKTKIVQIGYNAARHEQVRVELRQLSEAQTLHERLTNAYQNRDEWTTSQQDLQNEIVRLDAESIEIQAKINVFAETLQQRPHLETEQRLQHAQRRELEQKLSELQNEQGRLNQKLAQAATDQAAISQIDEDNKAAIQERDIYQHLVKAFSQDGIPALIIRQCLPDLQYRANELLQRLTDGRMSIYLETEKDRKDGSTKSTLDIKILDELGKMRAYETYSGGEAFRVNFALRIAISELLAERSGVRIQTLVIDEGFGTQDREGIDLIKQAIHTIMPNFEKIIIITHLDELKNAFPARIEVTKEPSGSRYEVLLD